MGSSPTGRQLADVYELRWGYTMGDLQNIARGAARATRMAADFNDLHADAFSAAAELLYSADNRPSEKDLFQAAQDALYDRRHKDRSYRGVARGRDGRWVGEGSAPRFAAYWWDEARPAPSPEDRIVERLALAQILPEIPESQRATFAALATFDDHQAAKAALGNPSWYGRYLWLGRRRFLALWHEGEQPSRVWGVDRRGSRPMRDRMRNTRNKRARKAAVSSAEIQADSIERGTP